MIDRQYRIGVFSDFCVSLGTSFRKRKWVLDPSGIARVPLCGHTGKASMQFDISDIFFILVVLSIAIAIINGSGGGGHRAPVRL
jgi:hypothetical protein